MQNYTVMKGHSGDSGTFYAQSFITSTFNIHATTLANSGISIEGIEKLGNCNFLKLGAHI